MIRELFPTLVQSAALHVTASTCTNGRHDRFKRNCDPQPTRVSLRLSRAGLSQRERPFVTGDGPAFVGLCHLCKTHRALSERLRMVAESTSLKGQVLVPRVLSQPGVFRKQEGFMSKTIQRFSVAVLFIVAMILVSGCATRKYVRQEIGTIEPRITEVRNTQAEQAERIDAVDRRAQEGLTAANNATMAAETANERAVAVTGLRFAEASMGSSTLSTCHTPCRMNSLTTLCDAASSSVRPSPDHPIASSNSYALRNCYTKTRILCGMSMSPF